METIRAIKNRRSIRKFKDDDIYKEQINKILDCGRLAPSAKNRQPCFFVVLTNKNKINDIADLMILNHSKEDDSYSENVLKSFNSVLATANVIKMAPVLIFIYQKDDENWTVGDTLSIGACIENMCLCACDLGLGSLWIRDIVYAQKEIMDYLKIGKEGYKLNSALCIGVTDESPIARSKNELNDISIWIN